MSIDDLLNRVRGEFREMPGLRLTVSQARRLWHVDEDTCQTLLDHLVDERFLCRNADGAYIVIPDVKRSPAKAGLPARDVRRPA